MFRDNLILLILKEFLNDINLCFYIKKKIDYSEEIDSHIIHYKLSKSYCQDIKLLYPGFFKTAIFSNIKFDDQDNIEPGWSFYKIKPLTSYEYSIDWNTIPPSKLSYNKYVNKSKYKKNGIYIINSLHKKYPDKIIIKLIKKRNRYAHYDFIYSHINSPKPISIWYDYETNSISDF